MRIAWTSRKKDKGLIFRGLLIPMKTQATIKAVAQAQTTIMEATLTQTAIMEATLTQTAITTIMGGAHTTKKNNAMLMEPQ